MVPTLVEKQKQVLRMGSLEKAKQPSVPNEELDPANIPEMGDHGRVCFEQSTLATELH